MSTGLAGNASTYLIHAIDDGDDEDHEDDDVDVDDDDDDDDDDESCPQGKEDMQLPGGSY